MMNEKSLRFKAAFETIGGGFIALFGGAMTIASVAHEAIAAGHNAMANIHTAEALPAPNSLKIVGSLAITAAGYVIAIHGSYLAAKNEG